MLLCICWKEYLFWASEMVFLFQQLCFNFLNNCVASAEEVLHCTSALQPIFWIIVLLRLGRWSEFRGQQNLIRRAVRNEAAQAPGPQLHVCTSQVDPCVCILWFSYYVFPWTVCVFGVSPVEEERLEGRKQSFLSFSTPFHSALSLHLCLEEV